MSGLKEIKRRQKTAQVIERMTSAMKMISRARYTSMQNEVRKNSGLTEILQDLVEKITHEMRLRGQVVVSDYTQDGNTKALDSDGSKDVPWLLLVMTSDSGLCGGFNQKLIKLAQDFLASRSTQAFSVLCIGKKGYNALQKKPGVVMCKEAPGTDMASLMPWITALFKKGEIRGCFVVYAQFFNILKQEPVVLPLLPIAQLDAPKDPLSTASVQEQTAASEDAATLMIEPDAKTVLDGVLEMLMQSILKKITQEHKLSEHAARMNAMDSASSNAQDMIKKLQIKYNRLRQDRITKEIIEIVSGSQAEAD